MARIPKYGQHKSTGQARVWINGKDIYLGPYGSAESRAKYARVIAESAAPPPEPSANCTVIELLASFWSANKTRYYKNGQPTSEHRSYKMAFAPVIALYGTTVASEFGPRALAACRKVLIGKGYCRQRINGHVYRIRKAFKWGVAQEFVHESTWRALCAVDGLRRGEAPDRSPIKPVAPEHVRAVLPYLSAQVQSMIQLQSLTCARPGEVCSIRTCDITMQGDVWLYIPESH